MGKNPNSLPKTRPERGESEGEEFFMDLGISGEFRGGKVGCKANF